MQLRIMEYKKPHVDEVTGLNVTLDDDGNSVNPTTQLSLAASDRPAFVLSEEGTVAAVLYVYPAMGRHRQHQFQRVLLAKCHNQFMVASIAKAIEENLGITLLCDCIRNYDPNLKALTQFHEALQTLNATVPDHNVAVVELLQNLKTMSIKRVLEEFKERLK